MQFFKLRRKAWKFQDFNEVWTFDLTIPVPCSNQLSYEANDVGSWSFVGSNVPVRNESMMKWYMKWIIHVYELQIWNQVDPRSYEHNFLQLRREAWEIQDFNGVWTFDLAIPVQCSNQLSYEATDVGSWSFVGSNVPVRNESMMKWYIKWIIHVYELQIWNQVDPRSYEHNFLQLHREAWQIQDFNGFEPVTSGYRCNALTNWAMKATDVGSWSFVGFNVLM